MSTSKKLEDLRKAGQAVHKFRQGHIQRKAKPERLFEFAAMLEVVQRLYTASAATGAGRPHRGTVMHGSYERFADAPGDRANFDYIRIAGFEVYAGVKFTGRSGADHAPDVVVAVPNPSGQPFPILVECKHYANDAVPRPLTNAFGGVLTDLDRPTLYQSLGSDVVQGARFAARKVLDDPWGHIPLGDRVAAMTDAGFSILETSCTSVPPEHDKIAALYGFVIHHSSSPNRLVT